MEQNHKILVVDDEKSVGKSIGRLLSMEGIDFLYTQAVSEALEVINSTDKVFSLVISDQRMPDMLGTDFLEKVKMISPDTIRILLTAYSDIETIVASINKGAVHRYIKKPWDNEMLMTTIKAGLKIFESRFDDNTLIATAKEQNKKLYHLDMELKTAIDKHEQEISLLDEDIDQIQNQIEKIVRIPEISADQIIEEMKTVFIKKGQLNSEMISSFYSDIMIDLLSEFEALANRDGFEMPKIMKDGIV